MNRFAASLIACVILCVASYAVAQERPTARPLGADRDLVELEESLFAVTIEEGEAIQLDARGVKRVSIDETKFAHIRHVSKDKQFILQANDPGKSVVRFHLTDGSVTTFIVTVGTPCFSKETKR